VVPILRVLFLFFSLSLFSDAEFFYFLPALFPPAGHRASTRPRVPGLCFFSVWSGLALDLPIRGVHGILVFIPRTCPTVGQSAESFKSFPSSVSFSPSSADPYVRAYFLVPFLEDLLTSPYYLSLRYTRSLLRDLLPRSLGFWTRRGSC